MAILVTGGAGYIGSHTCVELLKEGYEVVVVDNLYNSSEEALNRVKQITGKEVKFYNVDVLDREALDQVFKKESIDSVIHFAALKAVGESVAKPLEYYQNNITGTLTLCDVMRKQRSEKHRLQFLGNRVRRSRVCAHHRGLPQGKDHQPLRTDQEHDGADSYRLTCGRS